MKRFILLLLSLLLVFVCSSQVFAQVPPRLEEYGDCAVYYNGSKTNDVAYALKGNVYVSIDTVAKYGDLDRMTIDRSNLELRFNPADFSIFIGDTDTSTFIKKHAGECYLPLKEIHGGYYISIGSVAQLASLMYSYSDYRLYLAPLSSSLEGGTVGESGAEIAGSISDGSGENAVMSAGENAIILGQTASFYKIQSLDGEISYISKSDFSKSNGEAIKFDFIMNKKTKKNSGSNKINLVFIEGGTRTEICPESNGIDVVAPGWFSLVKNGGGTLKNYCDYGFVELAHECGYEVWAYASDFGANSGTGAKEFVASALANEKSRSRQIAQLLLYAAIYNLDGINIDYEYIIYDSGNFTSFTAFMTSLGKYCGKLGLKLSVDTNIPTSNNCKYFDFAALGSVCDYVIPMTYEQYNGKTNACSVSDKNYYTAWTNELIKFVPAKKILMGVPFYGVSWVYGADGSLEYKSAITEGTQRARLSENNVTPEWNDNLGQYYAEYYSNADGKLRRMYIEDARSLAERIKYVYSSGISGTACWRYGQHEPGILDVFYNIYKRGVSPGNYEKPY